MKFRVPLLTFSVCTALIALWLIAPLGSSLFDALALDQGRTMQAWRFVSAHALHTSATHLAWNIGALALIGTAIELESRTRLVLALLVGSAAVSVWFFMQDEFTRYVGASGALNTLLIVALYCQRQRLSNKVAALIALIAAIKVIIETLTHTSITSSHIPGAAWPSATGAHAAGYAAGVALVLLWVALDARARQTEKHDSKG
ncbi:MAG: rhomboid family intramembrane serine protease [Pseudomonadaceae bacterium]|nr:rhomboid family intramembrane serine protease [Pseudomonadaceae bacterium]